MNTFNMFIFMLGFGTGVFTVILCVFHFRKTKDSIALYILFAFISLTSCLIHSAVFSSIHLDSDLLNYLHDIFARAFYGLLSFSLILLTWKLSNKRMKAGIITLDLLWSFANLFIYLIYASVSAFRYDSEDIFIIAGSILLYIQLNISVIGCLVYFFKGKSKTRIITAKFKVYTIIYGLFVPLFVIQALTPKNSFIRIADNLRAISYPGLMFFYITVNISSIIFYINYLYQIAHQEKTISEYKLKEFGISGREKEVIELLHKGYSAKRIAARLYIAFGTAKTHINNIYRKTGSHNKIELFSKVYAPDRTKS